MSTAIIITSYNQAHTLKLLLASLDRQTIKEFEVIVADDGSSDSTAELCQQRRTFPLTLVTQPDLGYRKSKILNQAVRRTSADYLIFLDADVILEKHFVQDHLSLRKLGHFVCGRRVDLGPVFSKTITAHDVSCGRFDQIDYKLLLSSLKKDTLGLKRGLRVTPMWLRKLLKYDKPIDLLGSNFSLWKSDLVEVNGFNEGLESYWGEDGDLYIRLRNSKKISICAKSLCIQYHIFHKRRTPTEENVSRYQELLKDHQYVWAEQGLKNSNLN